MKITRLTQPLFSTIFLVGGVRTWRKPAMAAKTSAPLLNKLADVLPGSTGTVLTRNPEQTVRFNAALQAVAGGLLAVGVLPRAASAALAASLVPTTMAGHAYWEYSDPQLRANHRTHFLKNLSLIGALLSWAASPAHESGTDDPTK